MSTVAIVQARCGSTRFPKKVLQKIGKLPLIVYLYKRLRRSKLIDKIVIATTNNEGDNALVEVLTEHDIPFFRGDENDVLSRYYYVAKAESAQIVVRVTGDNSSFIVNQEIWRDNWVKVMEKRQQRMHAQ